MTRPAAQRHQQTIEQDQRADEASSPHAAAMVASQVERVVLTERDTDCFLELWEHPPAPNAKLIGAAKRLPPAP